MLPNRFSGIELLFDGVLGLLCESCNRHLTGIDLGILWKYYYIFKYTFAYIINAKHFLVFRAHEFIELVIVRSLL